MKKLLFPLFLVVGSGLYAESGGNRTWFGFWLIVLCGIYAAMKYSGSFDRKLKQHES